MSGPGALPAPDTVDTPDAVQAADEIATETLLRCWLRETGVRLPAGAGTLDVDLPASGLSLRAPVTHRSPSGWHRFGPPVLVTVARESVSVDAGLLAALLIREIVVGQRLSPARGATALGRIIESTRRIALHISAGRATGSGATATHPTGPAPVPPFLAAERALITGHPFHPAAQSRPGASESALAAYSPELGGSFALHWFAAHPSVVARSGQTSTRHLAGVRGSVDADGREVTEVTAALHGEGSGPTGPAGYLLIPAHPWQAAELTGRRDGPVADLLEDGRLVDLGASGPRWYPTASLRTVWRPDSPVMLKFSLSMRITNSQRTLHLGELRLGTMVARLVDAGIGAALTAHHPDFRIIGEPGWVAVTRSDQGMGAAVSSPTPVGAGEAESLAAEGIGLETAVRVNPFGPRDRVVCAAALIADRPDRGSGAADPTRGAMLPRLLAALADAAGEPVPTVAESWFGRYLRVLIAPVLDLYLLLGVGVEAHLQNTLVTLDADGWPVAGWYRDSQGYYIARSGAATAQRLVPGFATGLDAIFDDTLVAERIIYYLVVNNAFAVAGALGAAGVADEHRLLRRLRVLLHSLSLRGPDGPAHRQSGPGDAWTSRRALLDRLLDAPTLPSKANLRTCVDGRDELIGPVATQSVYVEVPNPLVEVHP